MVRRVLAAFAVAGLLVGTNGCAGSHKPATTPSPEETGWSGASTTAADVKGDPPIQEAVAKNVATGGAPTDGNAAPASASTLPAGGAGGSPAAATDDAVVSGSALPPAPGPAPQKAVKTGKAKKKGKKKAKAS